MAVLVHDDLGQGVAAMSQQSSDTLSVALVSCYGLGWVTTVERLHATR